MRESKLMEDTEVHCSPSNQKSRKHSESVHAGKQSRAFKLKHLTKAGCYGYLPISRHSDTYNNSPQNNMFLIKRSSSNRQARFQDKSIIILKF